MKRKALSILLCAVLAVSLAACGKAAETAGDSPKDKTEASSDLKLAWYAPAPHPYFEEVQKGVEKFSKDENIDVTIQIGPDWTQASENEKVEALVAQGVNAISIYPCDASGANGLYEEISKKAGVNVVNFGTDTAHPTSASFAVATDVKKAASDAAEAVIQMMGEKGKILNVLEVLEDPNTALRKEGVEEAVAKYPDVSIVQEIAGIKTQEEAVSKIESALSANVGNVDGIICTGMISSVGMTQTLSDYYQKQGTEKHIYTVGIDTDEGVMKGIENGTVDATIAQNSIGHGYISCMLLKHMSEGYQVKEGKYFIDAGNVLVTKDNRNGYQAELDKVTEDILGKLTTEYLTK